MPSRAITEVNTPVGALMGSITNLDNRLRIVEKREVGSGTSGGGGTTEIHAHINDTSGGVIDYLRTLWGTDHLNPALDPHTQYLTQARGNARYSLLGHNHDATYAALGTTITAGSGLTGGGDLSANRTLNVGAGTGITVAADTVAVDTTFLDSRYALVGHNHDATYAPLVHNHDAAYVNVTGDSMSGTLTVTAGGIAITGASTFSVAPTVGGSPLLTQTAGDARYSLLGHNHDAAYASRTTTLTAGAGLTGGGDLTANRTFDIGAGTGITVAADTVAVDTTYLNGLYAVTGHNHDAAYVNVTGDAMTGPLTISGNAVAASPDAGNSLIWHANGFYVAAGSIPISADPDNVIQMLGDGLFVRKGLIFGK